MFKNTKGFTLPEKLEKGVPHYVPEKQGVYMYIRTHAYMLRKQLSAYTKGTLGMFNSCISGVDTEQTAIYALKEKMPFDFFIEMANFYKYVEEINGTEANTHLFYIEEGYTFKDVSRYIKSFGNKEMLEAWKNGKRKYTDKFFAYTPLQTNTPTLTVFKDDKVFAELVRSKMVSVAMETHSHHRMDAFWSGTDNLHQNDTYYYGVLGKIHTEDAFLVKYVVDGVVTNLSIPQMEEIIDYPEIKICAPTNSLLAKTFDTDQPCKKYHGVIPYNPELFKQSWLKNILD